jgi:hypothetical protein
LTAIVKAARWADHVLRLLGTTVFAGRQIRRDECVVTAAHVALGFARFLLRNGVLRHDYFLSNSRSMTEVETWNLEREYASQPEISTWRASVGMHFAAS